MPVVDREEDPTPGHLKEPIESPSQGKVPPLCPFSCRWFIFANWKATPDISRSILPPAGPIPRDSPVLTRAVPMSHRDPRHITPLRADEDAQFGKEFRLLKAINRAEKLYQKFQSEAPMLDSVQSFHLTCLNPQQAIESTVDDLEKRVYLAAYVKFTEAISEPLVSDVDCSLASRKLKDFVCDQLRRDGRNRTAHSSSVDGKSPTEQLLGDYAISKATFETQMSDFFANYVRDAKNDIYRSVRRRNGSAKLDVFLSEMDEGSVGDEGMSVYSFATMQSALPGRIKPHLPGSKWFARIRPILSPSRWIAGFDVTDDGKKIVSAIAGLMHHELKLGNKCLLSTDLVVGGLPVPPAKLSILLPQLRSVRVLFFISHYG